ECFFSSRRRHTRSKRDWSSDVCSSDLSYFGTSVWRHALSRIPWLLFLMLSATASGLLLAYYENAMSAMPILITLIPMLMGTGGRSEERRVGKEGGSWAWGAR